MISLMAQVVHEWEGTEYEREEKSADWYWALGIIATASAVASVLFGNILLAIVILIGSVALALHAAKHSPVHHFALTEHGLVIGHDLHPFNNMHSFSVLEDIEGKEPPVLSIKTHSLLTPHLVLTLEGTDVDAIYAYLLERVEEQEHEHSLTELVSGWLGL